jgi:hypothetical protein
MFVKLILFVYIATLLFSCDSMHKLPYSEDENNSPKSKIFVLKCNDLELYPSVDNSYIKPNSFNNWTNFINCLRDSISINNIKYEKTYVDLINLDLDLRDRNWHFAELICNIRLRGDFVFKNLLNNSNKYFCYEDRSIVDSGDTKSIHSHFYKAYTSMIRSIEGMQVDDYLQNNISHTLEIQLKREKDKCDELLYKEYYEVIKKAYTEGKIVLKDYGEE